ncbi:DNA-binding protein [Kribbella pittospori]|uniref:DNA-binding protein n=1 Tax=Kribbella pittospori TaxID=722689 RepID=A0A4R0JYH8_9ACTN|nr:helix-turn-helix domain-containing protein [Kribbella pittospori]TCC52169.1 DNA-binding protein [Kribbella pittospori]
MSAAHDFDPLWTIDQVATYLGVPKRTLYRWRTLGYGPPGRRVGRHLRYRASDVIDWFASLDDHLMDDRWET